jgi:hypothetical protein
VNQCGFLINEREDIIDNDGHVKFIKEQLGPAGGMPALFSLKGDTFDIKDVIGRFTKEEKSKDIILRYDAVIGRSVDEDGRPVNASGYLIDEHGKGNIVDTNGKLFFNFWEIFFNEPPKIFSFTEFSFDWIKGALDRDVTQNPNHDDEVDDLGRKINTLGYLIDDKENIVD